MIPKRATKVLVTIIPVKGIINPPTLTPSPTPLSKYTPVNLTPTEPWGQVKQVGADTFEQRLANDPTMGTPKEIFDAQNNFRQNNGKGFLIWDDNLAAWAQERAQHFIRIGDLDQHAGFESAVQSKSQELRMSTLGENSYYGGRLEAVHLIEWVFASDLPHKENMLRDYQFVGVGVATADGQTYAVDVIFGANKY